MLAPAIPLASPDPLWVEPSAVHAQANLLETGVSHDRPHEPWPTPTWARYLGIGRAHQSTLSVIREG